MANSLANNAMLKSPTFFVGAQKQRGILDEFHRQDQHLEEAYTKNRPLCYRSAAYQKTHPSKARNGHKDADATLDSPMVLGVADGVSQVEEFGIDASLLPNELLRFCEDIAMAQLIPGAPSSDDPYRGPIPLLKEAFESTESLGSTTIVLSLLDNSTRIHGKLHPMMAVITIGDCELLILRRTKGKGQPLEAVFHTEMQRIDGHVQTPLQLARVDDRVDPDFDESITIEVIERGSAVHCVSAYEGDVVVMGSDGVFDNLFLDELVALCNQMLPQRSGRFEPATDASLSMLARRIVDCSHAKTRPGLNGELPEAPIGRGGKMDDTSCVVGELIEWTDEHIKHWTPRNKWDFSSWVTSMDCGSNACTANMDDDYGRDGEDGPYDGSDMVPAGHRTARSHTARSDRSDRSDAGESDDEEEGRCAIS